MSVRRRIPLSTYIRLRSWPRWSYRFVIDADITLQLSVVLSAMSSCVRWPRRKTVAVRWPQYSH